MIYISLSVLQSVLILVTFKLFDKFRIDNLQAIVTNYLVAASFGFLITQTTWSPATLPGFTWFPTAIMLGMLFIATFFVFALASQKVGVAVTSVASKMSLVIPIIAGIFLFGEHLNWIRIAGILMALTAFYLTFSKKDDHAGQRPYFWLTFLVFAGNGLVDTTMKFADHHFIRGDLILFLAIVFTVGFIIGSCILAWKTIKKTTVLQWRNVLGGILLGLLNFGSTYYMLKAISVYESSVVFTVTNAAIVGLSGIIGFAVFREKLRWINWLGIGLAIVAIMIIARG